MPQRIVSQTAVELSEEAIAILSIAEKRSTGFVLPLPDALEPRSGRQLIKELLAKKLVVARKAEASAPRWSSVWGQRTTLLITEAGRRAICDIPRRGVGRRAGDRVKTGRAIEADNTQREYDGRPTRISKSETLRQMLASENGMTIPEAAKVTGWMEHSIRGLMSGVLRKKLSLRISSTKVEGRGRVYRLDG